MPILKLTPSCKDYLWGGSRLRTDFGIKSDLDPLAEAWVLSCHPDATLVAGGLGLFIGNVVAAALLHELAAGHQLHGIRVAPLLHRALDGDQIVFFHGVPLR